MAAISVSASDQEKRSKQLRAAIALRDDFSARMFLATRVDPNFIHSIEPLESLEKPLLQLVEILLAAGANPNDCDLLGDPLLFHAARLSVPAVEMLLAAGADPNAFDNFGNSLLHYAESYPVRLVEILLAHGANPNAPDDEGKPPLILATIYGSAELVRILLAAGADPNAQAAAAGGAPLHIAAEGRDPAFYSEAADNAAFEEIVDSLLAAGADPNARDDEGRTPLHKAAFGVNVNLTATDGSIKNLKTVQSLLAAGADPDLADNDGRRPDDVAEGATEILEALAFHRASKEAAEIMEYMAPAKRPSRNAAL